MPRVYVWGCVSRYEGRACSHEGDRLQTELGVHMSYIKHPEQILGLPQPPLGRKHRPGRRELRHTSRWDLAGVAMAPRSGPRGSGSCPSCCLSPPEQSRAERSGAWQLRLWVPRNVPPVTFSSRGSLLVPDSSCPHLRSLSSVFMPFPLSRPFSM